MERTSQPIPTGTVTLMFTDIQASTQLWEQFKGDFMPLLERHRGILRQATGRGYEVSAVGDSFFLVFESPVDALHCALESQQAFQNYPWSPGARIQVRMGLHTGTPIVHEGDYFGPPANKAARIAAAGHGGQILLSGATMELVQDDLPKGLSLVDLGVHRLKDVSRPEHLFQVSYPGMPESFPPLRTLDVVPNNLPVQLTSFVGRETELQTLADLLIRGNVRLITLTGPGGTGKTRLSLQVGAELLHYFPDGVWFVDLSALREVVSLDAEIARTLYVPSREGASTKHVLMDYLRYKHCLLVLDNFEQLMDGAVLVAELLQAAPELRCLVTSREVLRVRGEREFPVSPLSVPKAGGSAERLSQFEGIRLFLERAQAVRPDFCLTDENGPAVVELCHRLDGIPLAIELAAARVRGMTPQQILKRMEQQLDILATRQRDVPARQRTLRQAIDWSYELLSEEEKVLFPQLSVFVGGFFLEQAEAICEAFDVLEGVFSLQDQSLLRAEELPEQMRYRMLETIRVYAAEKLGAEGERVRRQHAAHFLSLAEGWAAKMRGSEERETLETIALELDNLKAGMDWAREAGEDRWIGGYGLALGAFFEVRGLWAEGRERLRMAEEALHRVGDAQGVVQALVWRATYGWKQGDYAEAQRLFEQGLGIARGGEDREGVASCLYGLGNIAAEQGEYADAQKLHAESLGIRKGLGNRWGMALSLNSLGLIAANQGEYAEAQRLYTESLSIRKDLDDWWGIASSLNNLGLIPAEQGDYAEAQRLFTESLGIRKGLGDRWGMALSLNNIGSIAANQGEYAEARKLFSESLEIDRDLGDCHRIALSLNNLGLISTEQGEYAEARRLFSESLEIWRGLDNRWGIALSLNNLGLTDANQGDYAEARKLFSESLEIRKDLGDRQGIASSLYSLGRITADQGDYAEAWPLLDESLRIAQELGDRRTMADDLNELGGVALKQKKYSEAQRLLRESLEIGQALGLKPQIAGSLHRLGQLAQTQGDPECANSLLVAALRLYEELSSPKVQQVQAEFESLRVALGEELFSAVQVQAERQSTEEVLSLALQAQH